ncbi:MAG: DUF1294 domain-containing protein [Clostridia bacterium]|nr:DUF1294 domain-containing protein [Clostridia bacterium]
MTYIWWEILGLFAYNLIVAFIYGIDKWKSTHGGWRISEKVLLLLTFLLGAVGAVMGMLWFNHKTAKMKFRLLVPLALILNLFIYVLFFWDSIQI